MGDEFGRVLPLATDDYRGYQLHQAPLLPDGDGAEREADLINPVYAAEEDGGVSTSVFHPFPRLPVEIRQAIWTESLRVQRLIPVSIRNRHPDEPPEVYGPNFRVYRALVCCQQFYSRLLRVNRDARMAALRFYRVRIACYAELATPVPEKFGRPVMDNVRTVVLYINPEYDTLRLRVSSGVGCSTFLSQLKAADPRGVGIRALAMGTSDLQELSAVSSSPELLKPTVRAAVESILTGLDSMLLVSSLSDATRCNFVFSCARPGRPQLPVIPPYNRSVPVLGGTARFESLGPDPRPIVKDTRLLTTKSDGARRCVAAWRQLLRAYDLPEEGLPVRCSYMFFSEPNYFRYFHLPGRVRIQSRQAATAFLQQREVERTRKRTLRKQCALGDHGSDEEKEEKVEEEEGPKIPMAMGFWLFPVEALGGVDGLGDTQSPKSLQIFSGCDMQVIDLEKYWPELFVFMLPS